MNLRALTASPAVPALAAGAGALALLALVLARRSRGAAQEAVRTGAGIRARLTTYYPLREGLSEKQRRMEGGIRDRKGRPIITWEMHLRDPAKYPYVSVAGDYTIWPDGQRIMIPEFPNIILRVVDTGGHFFGADKVIRVSGHEPLDIAVDDERSRERIGLPKTAVVRPVPGDNFARGQAVAYSKLPGPVVVGAYARGLEAIS